MNQDMGKLFPLVAEANAIAKNAKRPITFTIKMEKNKSITSNPLDERTELWVLVDNHEEEYHYQWSMDKFLNRIDMIRSQFNKYFDDGAGAATSDRERDNLFDLPDPYLVGQYQVPLASLLMNQVIDLDRDLVGAFGPRPVGSLKIRVRQCDETGEGNPPADMNVQNPNQLLGKRMWFRVEVHSAKNVPTDLN